MPSSTDTIQQTAATTPLTSPLSAPFQQPAATTPLTSPSSAPFQQSAATTPLTSPPPAPFQQPPTPAPSTVPFQQSAATTPLTSPSPAPFQQPPTPAPSTVPFQQTAAPSPLGMPPTSPPAIKLNHQAPWAKIQQLSLSVKIVAGLGASLLITFAVLYSLFGGHSPEGQLNDFRKAVEARDVNKVMGLITSEAPIDEASVKKFVEYLGDNPSFLKDYSSDRAEIKDLVREDGKKLFIFQQYKVIVPTIELNVDIDSMAAILVDGKEALASTNPGKNLVGKFMPGNHTLQAKAKLPFGEFVSEVEDVELIPSPGQTISRIFNLSIKAPQVYLSTKSSIKSAKITVDGTELVSNADLTSRNIRLSPMPAKAGVPVKITGKFSFGDYTESFTTPQTSANFYSNAQSVPTSADNKPLLDSIAKILAQYNEAEMAAYTTGDLTALKECLDTSNSNITRGLTQLEDEIKTRRGQNYSFNGKYLGLTIDVSTLSIDQNEQISVQAKADLHNNKWIPAGATLDEPDSQVALFILKNVNGVLKITGYNEYYGTNLTGTDLVPYKK